MRKIFKNKKIIIGLIILGIFSVNSVAFASELEVHWPPSPLGTLLTDASDLTIFIRYLYEWGIALGGLAAFIALIIAGFQYLTSVGDPARMKEAMDRIKSAFLGLVLLLGSWLILNTINPQLTTLHVPLFRPGDIPEIEKEVEEISKEITLDKLIGEKFKACEKAKIIVGDRTATLKKANKCVEKFDDGEPFLIDTDQPFSIEGLIDDEPTPCAGLVYLTSGKKCETTVAAYILTETTEDAVVDEVVQGAVFLKGKK